MSSPKKKPRKQRKEDRETDNLSKSSKMTVSGTISLKLDTASNSVFEPVRTTTTTSKSKEKILKTNRQ